jgi:hypothetical protein
MIADDNNPAKGFPPAAHDIFKCILFHGSLPEAEYLDKRNDDNNKIMMACTVVISEHRLLCILKVLNISMKINYFEIDKSVITSCQ